jgi:hypothetical protein
VLGRGSSEREIPAGQRWGEDDEAKLTSERKIPGERERESETARGYCSDGRVKGKKSRCVHVSIRHTK